MSTKLYWKYSLKSKFHLSKGSKFIFSEFFQSGPIDAILTSADLPVLRAMLAATPFPEARNDLKFLIGELENNGKIIHIWEAQ